MRNHIRIAFLLFLVLVYLSSCGLIELTQEDAFNVSAHGSSYSVNFSARNLSDRDINNVRWKAVIYDSDDGTVQTFSGREGFVPKGRSFHHNLSLNSCACYDVSCARITVKWDNKKGRTCYEWCTIIL